MVIIPAEATTIDWSELKTSTLVLEWRWTVNYTMSSLNTAVTLCLIYLHTYFLNPVPYLILTTAYIQHLYVRLLVRGLCMLLYSTRVDFLLFMLVDDVMFLHMGYIHFSVFFSQGLIFKKGCTYQYRVIYFIALINSKYEKTFCLCVI